jgi:hypothetical protein
MRERRSIRARAALAAALLVVAGGALGAAQAQKAEGGEPARAREVRVEPLDLFTFEPAPFYRTAEGEPAAWAAKAGVACWVVAVRGLEAGEGARVSAALTLPEALEGAKTAVYGWSAGEGAFVRPDEAGMAVGDAPLVLAACVALGREQASGHYAVGLSLGGAGAGAQTKLRLVVMPFELEGEPLESEWPGRLGPGAWLALQRAESNRVAALLRARAEAGARTVDSLRTSLAAAALRSAGSRPMGPEDVSPARPQPEALAAQDAEERTWTRTASVPDLRRWHAAWMNMRLARAEAGFYVGLTDPRGLERQTIRLKFLPEEPRPRRARVICALAARPPDLDGQLTEPCWDRAGRLAAFRPGGERPGKAGRETAVRLCHAGGRLYVGVRADGSPEPAPDGETPAEAAVDAVVVSLWPVPGTSAPVTVTLDAAGGCRVEPADGLGRPEPGLGPLSVAHRAGAAWTAEASVPLPDVQNDWWVVSAARSVPGPGGGDYLLAPGVRGVADVPEGVDMVLERARCALRRFELEPLGTGSNVLRFTLWNRTALALKLEAVLALRRGREAPQTVQALLPAMPALSFVRYEMPFEVGSQGSHSLHFSIREAGSGAPLTGVTLLRVGVRGPATWTGQPYLTKETEARVRVDFGLSRPSRRRSGVHVWLEAVGRRGSLGDAWAPVVSRPAAVVTMPVAELPAGVYGLRLSLDSAAGELDGGRFVFAVLPHFLDRDAAGW